MERTSLVPISLIVLFFLRRCNSHSIVDANYNPFDGGAVDSCKRPSFLADSICGQVVDYEVPSSIARLVQILEGLIVSNAEDLLSPSDGCKDAYQKILCIQRFPQCKSNGTVLLGKQNATLFSQLREECADEVVRRVGDQEVSVQRANTCRPVEDLVGSDFSFARCHIDLTNPMTLWMVEYLKLVDRTISNEQGIVYTSSGCGAMFSSYICDYIGRCSEDGVNVEYINTYEKCTTVISCYSLDIQDLLTDAIDCEQWPMLDDRRLPTTSPPNASSTSADVENSKIKDASSGTRTAVTFSSLLLGTILSYSLSLS